MSPARRAVEEYTALLTRAFNGAIEVNGDRIVAHPSGTLLARTKAPTAPLPVGEVVWTADRDSDWSDV
jgi:hypothetical protein